MRRYLLFFKEALFFSFLIFFSFINSSAQISTITYTGNTSLSNINNCPSCCNVFEQSGNTPTVSGFRHYPVSGGATFDGTNINLQSQFDPSSGIDNGTAYAIGYPFLSGGYSYVITADIAYTSTPSTAFPKITFSLANSLPNPGNSDPIDCGAVSNNKYNYSLGSYQNVIYPSQTGTKTYTINSFTITSAMNYLFITISGGSSSAITTTSISKITITQAPPAPPTCTAIPTGLTTGSGGTLLVWNAAGVSSYNLSITDTHNGVPTITTKTGIISNHYGFCATGVGDNVSFKVQSVCSNGVTSGFSAPYSYTFSPAPLAAPTGITYTSPNTISWNAVPNASVYIVNASGQVYPVNGTSVSGADAEITPGHIYDVTVQAQNPCVSGPFSSPAVHFTAASCGPAPVAVVTAGTTVTLYPVPNAVSYNIGFKNANGTLAYTFSNIPPATATNYYQCKGIAAGYYYIEGQANCSIGTSTWSAPYNGNLQYARIASGNVTGLNVNNNNSFIQTDKGLLVEVKKSGVSFENLIGLSVYPNPSSSDVNLRFHALKNGNAQIVITNELGDILLSKSISETLGQNNYYLNLGKFINGVYTIKLVDKESVSVKKVIIQK